MATGKRASMREGPLAALFRKTAEDAHGEEQKPEQGAPTEAQAPEQGAPTQPQQPAAPEQPAPSEQACRGSVFPKARIRSQA